MRIDELGVGEVDKMCGSRRSWGSPPPYGNPHCSKFAMGNPYYRPKPHHPPESLRGFFAGEKRAIDDRPYKPRAPAAHTKNAHGDRERFCISYLYLLFFPGHILSEVRDFKHFTVVCDGEL